MDPMATIPRTNPGSNQPRIRCTRYHGSSGWSAELPAELDSPSTLVLAFGASSFADNPAPLEEIHRAFPLSQVIGCSTAGEILDESLTDDTVVLSVVPFRSTRLKRTFTVCRNASESFSAGKTVGHRLAEKDLRAVLVLSDGLNVNGSSLVEGLRDSMPPGVVITGGLAGDGSRFERTWVLREGQPDTGIVSAVAFYGPDVRVTHGSRGGWDVFGPQKKVTRSEGNVLLELDGQPALNLYKKYLGVRAVDLPASGLLFPLSITTPEQSDPVVRTLLAVDEARQSLTFAGDIPIGASAQLMQVNFNRLISAAAESSIRANRGTEGQAGAALSIAISCVGRRLVLRERAEEELRAAASALSPGDRQIGFYSYGELSPIASGKCELHNQTMTITRVFEA